jgi:hypothetical protein
VQHAFFDDMMRSSGRGVMYAFKVMCAPAMPGAIVLVLAVAVLVSRR